MLEQSEDYPGVLAQQESVRAYPSPYGVNGAHVLGYLSPITEGELDEAREVEGRLAQRRLGGRPGRGREGLRQLPAG